MSGKLLLENVTQDEVFDNRRTVLWWCFPLGIGAYTGLWLMPVQYERIARAAGNGQIDKNILKVISKPNTFNIVSI